MLLLSKLPTKARKVCSEVKKDTAGVNPRFSKSNISPYTEHYCAHVEPASSIRFTASLGRTLTNKTDIVPCSARIGSCVKAKHSVKDSHFQCSDNMHGCFWVMNYVFFQSQ